MIYCKDCIYWNCSSREDIPENWGRECKRINECHSFWIEGDEVEGLFTVSKFACIEGKKKGE